MIQSKQFSTLGQFYKFIEREATLPKGFLASTDSFDFFPSEKKVDTPYIMNLALVSLEEKTEVFAGSFTKNACPGYPVLIGREFLNERWARGVVINNKIANVHTKGGFEVAKEVSSKTLETLGGEGVIFPCSTGIIGWQLPKKEILEKIPSLVKNLEKKNSLSSVAEAIMTTDSWPKARTIKLGEGRITAIAKGAGMIEPNLATMLVFLFTDIAIERNSLRRIHKKVGEETFNRISIDSDQSTSDTFLSFSSCQVKGVTEEEFYRGAKQVCQLLSEDIVRNGEGVTLIIEASVSGLPKEEALTIGRGVVNSPLTKTALFGGDPNVGRFLQAIGDAAGNNNISINPKNLTIKLGGETVFSNGYFQIDEIKEAELSTYIGNCQFPSTKQGFPFYNESVKIEIIFGGKKTEAVTVLGSDLSHDYVSINGNYRNPT